MWTRFMDMHSGGGLKEDFELIYIEAESSEAKVIFYNRFGHNPERVTCTCCGEDYSIDESETLEQATGYERGCAYDYFKGDERLADTQKENYSWINKNGFVGRYVDEPAHMGYRDYVSLDDYVKSGKAKFIYADDIKIDERTGEVPVQGYVWAD